MSKHILSSGIFGTEPGQRLLSICDLLTRRAFEGLYAKCKQDVSGNYYQTGLRRVHLWSDELVQQDILFVRNSCPDIDETYQGCFVHYVEERYRGNQRPVVQCPPLIQFVRRYLESVALHEMLILAEFFTTRDIVQKRITCMDACRQTFYSIVNTDSVRMETESVAPSRTIVEPQAVILDNEPEIHPSDSVSQIEVPQSVISQSFEKEVERPPTPVKESRATSPPPPPSSYISTASSTSRLRVHDSRNERLNADDSAGRHYHPELRDEEEARSEASRHDFEMIDSSVVSLKTRSAVGSRDSSVSIGMKRLQSPRRR